VFDQSFSPKEIEKLCFRFAGALLMPAETFIRELGAKRNSISMNELVHLKEVYGLSVQAIMARAKDLEVINDFYFLRFRQKIASNRKEEGLGKYKGIETGNRFRQLVYRAVSEEIITMSKAADLCGLKLAEFRNEYVAT
jgi:Zn-dependent peptidase ImmA (M78 family)